MRSLVRQQQPAHVLAGVAGQGHQVDLADARRARAAQGCPEVLLGLVEALLSRSMPPYRCSYVIHRLLRIHGAMFAHTGVATSMVPP